ncbi:MAG: phosphate/phosphite/phosphonate ABC transporter substrate-binding protein [Gammaproteobacteria bacterium]|nr:phosphate/phosphite/phosphonate ABC transporter substrate-binding protein [Gammaproteobacteria bacterium]
MLFKLKPVVFLAVLFLLACTSDHDQNNYQPSFASANNAKTTTQYIFGVHPLHNPQRLHEVFSPLMTYLSQHVDNATFKLEASRNYASYNKKLYAGKFDFALPNPYQTVNAIKKGYKVFGKMADDHKFRGIILVRKDSQIQSISDLKGKVVSYPAPTALAATMMPQYYIQTHGLNVMKDIDNRYVGSQESSIMNVFFNHSAAAATWPFPWISLSRERPELAQQLEVKWQTETLPNNGLIVKPDVDQAVVDKVGFLLFRLHQNTEGKEILSRMELSAFEVANQDTYLPVSQFLEKFSREVRPLN